MAIFSKIKKAVKSFTSAAGNVLSSIGGKSNAASAGMSFPGVTSASLNQAAANRAANTGARTGVQYYENKTTPQGEVSYGTNNPDIIVGGKTYYNAQTPGSAGANAFNSLPSPVTIGAGQNRRVSNTNVNVPMTPGSPISASSLGVSSSFGTNLSAPQTGGGMSMPTKPSVSNPGLVNNAAFADSLSDSYSYDPVTNSYSSISKPTDGAGDPEVARRKKVTDFLLERTPKKESVLNSPEVQRQQEEIQRRQQEVNNYTAQLNAISAKQNQDLLSLRETGSKEGVTEAVYGGQATTINREAAIRALPVQASLAAAQGNLQLAQDFLKQITDLRKEEIDLEYAYQTDLYNSISDFVTGEEKIRLDKLKTQEERAYRQVQDNIDRQDAWAKQALSSGQTNLISTIHSLNPSSATFQRDLNRIIGQMEGGANNVTSQVIDGFTTLDDLTPTEAQKVRDELYAKGFNSDTPPDWYKDYLQEEAGKKLGINQPVFQPDNVVKSQWISYRDTVMKNAKGKTGGLNFDDL